MTTTWAPRRPFFYTRPAGVLPRHGWHVLLAGEVIDWRRDGDAARAYVAELNGEAG